MGLGDTLAPFMKSSRCFLLVTDGSRLLKEIGPVVKLMIGLAQLSSHDLCLFPSRDTIPDVTAARSVLSATFKS